VLFGRDEEAAALRDRVEAAAAHRGQVVIIEGEAGIGKTRLLADVLAFAASRDFKVFTSGCEELEYTLPFSAMRRALRAHENSPDARLAAIGELLSDTATEELSPLVPAPPNCAFECSRKSSHSLSMPPQ
jgi:predicted ATPase